jgi:starch phosphorylase
MFKQSIVDGWQKENPDNWIRWGDPWEVARPHEKVEVKLGCTFQLRGGNFQVIPGRPSSLFGIPFDRPVVGYGGKTINTLRLWAAAAPDYFDFEEFGTGDFVGALSETLEAESLLDAVSGRLHNRRARTTLLTGVLPGCVSLADLVRRFAIQCGLGKLPEQRQSSLMTRIHRWPSPN